MSRIVFIYLMLAGFTIIGALALHGLLTLAGADYGEGVSDLPFPAFVCMSSPFALVLTAIVFFFLNRRALREDRAEALKHTSQEKSVSE